MDLKKRRKTRYKRGITRKKKNGFVGLDTFMVKKRCDDGKVRLKPAEKEDGTHSREWALAIVRQPGSPLLSLPLELRQRIYTYVFNCPVPGLYSDSTILTPRKKGNCYTNQGPVVYQFINGNSIEDPEATLVEIYNTLSLLNKQTYLDLVGSSLLYRVATLSFESVYMMTSFLEHINPVHCLAIRSLKLTLKCTPSCPSLPPLVFRTLSSLTGLKHLHLNILVDAILLEANGLLRCSTVNKDVIKKWEGSRWDLLKEMDSFKLSASGFHVWRGMSVGRGIPTRIVGMNEVRRLLRRRFSRDGQGDCGLK